MTKTLIEHGWVVPVAGGVDAIPDGAVAVDGDRIVAVGPRDEVAAGFAAERTIDAGGKAVLPGLVNTHTHLVGALNKATTEDAKKAGGDSFKRGILFQEDYVGRDDVYAPGMVHGLEMLRTGTTTINEMWWHMPEPARVARDLGLRAVIGGVVREMNTGHISPGSLVRDWDAAIAERNLAECEALIAEWHGSADGRITCRVAPDGPDRMRPETLVRCREMAARYGVGLHAHVASVPAEQGFLEHAYGKRAVPFLHDLGLLGPDLVAVHCVFVDEAEVELLAATGTRLSHTAYLVGKRGYYPPMDRIYAAGIAVSLGTDWMSNDLWKVMRAAIMLGRVQANDAALLDGRDALRMATLGGAECLGMDADIGSLEPGKKADIILVDLATPWCSPIRPENLIADIVYNANGSDVTHVMIDGRLVVEDRRHAWIDEAEAMRAGQAVADRVWGAAAHLFAAVGQR